VRGDLVTIDYIGGDGNPKRRPAVVLTSWEWTDNTGGTHTDYWITIISTQTRDSYSVEITAGDIESGVLHSLPCRVRCTNILVTTEGQLIRKIGNLTAAKLQEILAATKSLLN